MPVLSYISQTRSESFCHCSLDITFIYSPQACFELEKKIFRKRVLKKKVRHFRVQSGELWSNIQGTLKMFPKKKKIGEHLKLLLTYFEVSVPGCHRDCWQFVLTSCRESQDLQQLAMTLFRIIVFFLGVRRLYTHTKADLAEPQSNRPIHTMM